MRRFDSLSPVNAYLARYATKGHTPIPVYSPDFDKHFKSQTLAPSPPSSQLISVNDFDINLVKVSYKQIRESAISFLESRRPPQIGSEKLRRFVERLFGKYNFVPYHNFCHGFSVMQVFNAFSERHANIGDLFDQKHLFFSCLAALGHDAGHFGKNNPFCVSKQNKVAIKGLNSAVLEKMHIKNTFYAMGHQDSNLLAGLSPKEAATVRQTIIEVILGTDMAVHNDLVARFKQTAVADFGTNSNFLSAYLVHCGDLGNLGLPYDKYLDWAKLVLQEFHTQTLSEAKNGLPVSKFMVYSGFEGIISDQLFFGSELTRHVRSAAVHNRRREVRVRVLPGTGRREPRRSEGRQRERDNGRQVASR